MANTQTSVPLFVANAVLTAAQQNISAATGVPVFATSVTRDAAFGGSNKALAEGQLCYLESTNVVQYYDGAAWATVGPSTSTTFSSAVIATSQTTTSTSYTDLSTAGPAVTLTTGTRAYVILTTYTFNNTANSTSSMGFAVSGATTIAAADTSSILFRGNIGGGQDIQVSAVYEVTLTAGSNVSTTKYKVSGNTGTFANRGITVIAV